MWQTYSPIDGDEVPHATWYSTRWLVSECFGIADSLAAIHSSLGNATLEGSGTPEKQWHMDIKPENILCFRSNNDQQGSFTLKVADFGLARQADHPVSFNNTWHLKTYRPPEHDFEVNASPKYDVWCLGCLFMEFITWAILGWQGIQTFKDNRERERHDPEVNTSIGTIIEDIFFRKSTAYPRFYSGWRTRVGSTIERMPDSRSGLLKRYFLWFEFLGIRIKCKIKEAVNKVRSYQ